MASMAVTLIRPGVSRTINSSLILTILFLNANIFLVKMPIKRGVVLRAGKEQLS